MMLGPIHVKFTKLHDRVRVLPFQKYSLRNAAGGLVLLPDFFMVSPVSFRQIPECRSLLPRGLKRGSGAAHLMELRDRIPPGIWKLVYCESCVFLHIEVSVTARLLVQRIPTDCGVSEYDLETSTMRRCRPD